MLYIILNFLTDIIRWQHNADMNANIFDFSRIEIFQTVLFESVIIFVIIFSDLYPLSQNSNIFLFICICEYILCV